MANDNTEEPPFEGFDEPEQNWFRLPENWTDITRHITTIAELKCVEYVLKHTWGYLDFTNARRISVNEFMRGRKKKDGLRLDDGTGLSKPSVISGLELAVKHGYLLEEIDDSDKGRVKKYYQPNMRNDQKSMEPADNETATAADPQPPSRKSPPGAPRAPRAGKENDLNSGVKHLYRGEKNLYPSGKTSLPRSEADTGVGIGRALTGTGRDDDATPTSKLSTLPDLGYSDDEVGMLVDLILTEYYDDDGKGYAILVARKVDHQFVRETMASIRQTPGVRKRGALFNHRIEEWAQKQVDKVNAAAAEQKLEEIKGSNGAVTDGPWKRVGE